MAAMRSPSMRREWIEIFLLVVYPLIRGSPSMRREWIEMAYYTGIAADQSGLPPCGGSGLKCF